MLHSVAAHPFFWFINPNDANEKIYKILSHLILAHQLDHRSYDFIMLRAIDGKIEPVGIDRKEDLRYVRVTVIQCHLQFTILFIGDQELIFILLSCSMESRGLISSIVLLTTRSHCHSSTSALFSQ